MSYSVSYEGTGYTREQGKAKVRKWIWLLAVVALILITMLLKQMCIGDYLIPGDPSVTTKALSQMIEDLQQGDSIGQAATAFCRQVINGK